MSISDVGIIHFTAIQPMTVGGLELNLEIMKNFWNLSPGYSKYLHQMPSIYDTLSPQSCIIVESLLYNITALGLYRYNYNELHACQPDVPIL